MVSSENCTFFHNDTKLLEIFCDKNCSKRISVKMVNLSHNNITIIDVKAFTVSVNLEFLDLSDNQISTVETPYQWYTVNSIVHKRRGLYLLRNISSCFA